MENKPILIDINEEMLNKYLTMVIDETFALELQSVLEIIEYRPVTRVPETPDYIAGMLNLRGSVLPVIDMRERFKKPPASEELTQRCIVVIRFEESRLGLIVDNVTDLIQIDPEMVVPPPQVGTDYSHVFVKAIGVKDNVMHLILDTDKIINLSELSFIEQTEQQEPETQE